jgi:hypothetical protein
MAIPFVLCTLAGILTPAIAAQKLDRERVREHARLTWVHFETGIRASWTPFQAQERTLTSEELAGEIAENEKLIRSEPNDADAHIKISKLYLQAKRYQEAAEHRDKGLTCTGSA